MQMAIGETLNFDIQSDSLELHKIFADIEERKESLGMLFFSLSLIISFPLLYIYFEIRNFKILFITNITRTSFLMICSGTRR